MDFLNAVASTHFRLVVGLRTESHWLVNEGHIEN